MPIDLKQIKPDLLPSNPTVGNKSCQKSNLEFLQQNQSWQKTNLLSQQVGQMFCTQNELINCQSIVEAKHYNATGIDGSQIYADAHEDRSYSLLNLAAAQFFYDQNPSNFDFVTKPQVYAELLDEDQLDALRQIEEIKFIEQIKPTDLVLYDGSLSFLFKQPNLEKQQQIYANALQKIIEDKKLICSYQEIKFETNFANFLRLEFCQAKYFALSKCAGECGSAQCATLSALTDFQILDFMLKPNNRSNLFCTATLPALQETDLRFAHFYLKTVHNHQASIGKIEIILDQQTDLAKICTILAAQIRKGFGYPLCLAEAHQLAVIRAHEAALLDHLFNGNQPISQTKKNLRKNILVG